MNTFVCPECGEEWPEPSCLYCQEEREAKPGELPKTVTMSDTPRTDTAANKTLDEILSDFRQIERELNEANRKLSVVAKAVDLAEQLNNASTDNQVAATANFNEAVVGIELERVEAERDQLRAEVERLKGIKTPCYCLGVTTIAKVADDGQLQTNHVAFVAASDLYHQNPYKQRDEWRECAERWANHYKFCTDGTATLALFEKLKGGQP